MEENKGLCFTCANDKECTFPRKFPVWQCEEFTVFEYESKPQKIPKINQNKIESSKETGTLK